jgi:hypothetical protein
MQIYRGRRNLCGGIYDRGYMKGRSTVTGLKMKMLSVWCNEECCPAL